MSTARKMVINKPSVTFNSNYELSGIDHLLKTKTPEELAKLFPQGIPNLQALSTSIKNEEDFWNSDLFSKQKESNDNKLFNLQDEGKSESAGKCAFCRSTNTRLVSKIQLRSADEAMNYIVQCMACGKRKIS